MDYFLQRCSRKTKTGELPPQDTEFHQLDNLNIQFLHLGNAAPPAIPSTTRTKELLRHHQSCSSRQSWQRTRSPLPLSREVRHIDLCRSNRWPYAARASPLAKTDQLSRARRPMPASLCQKQVAAALNADESSRCREIPIRSSAGERHPFRGQKS